VRALADRGRDEAQELLAAFQASVESAFHVPVIALSAFATEDELAEIWRIDVTCGEVRVLVSEALGRLEARATTRSPNRDGQSGYLVVTGISADPIEALVRFGPGVEDGEFEGRALLDRPADWRESDPRHAFVTFTFLPPGSEDFFTG
jgi:hypothetical protein